MKFRVAMGAKPIERVVTENGMPVGSSAGSALVDWFYQMGAFRSGRVVRTGEGLLAFRKAFNEDEGLALRSLFYLRDVRKGLGERTLFRTCLTYLAHHRPDLITKNLHNVPFYGRWDDLECLLETPVQGAAVKTWADGLLDDSAVGLAAKWAPRKGPWFGLLRKHFGADPKALRKALVEQTKVVENLMCKNEWGVINYSQVPSQAGLMYRKAFRRHDTERYVKFLEAVKSGEKKINASTLLPHQIVEKAWGFGQDQAELDVLWKAIPNLFSEGEQSILPVCDVSGSMSGQPIYVSIGLGLYLAEHNKGDFANLIVTFSAEPQFAHFDPEWSLTKRITWLSEQPWGMNTNIEAVFSMMLRRAIDMKVPPSDMPSMLLILSDMQFDQCAKAPREDAMSMIERSYHESGYPLPQVVFWNLRTSSGVPVSMHKTGAALVSGFSPAVMRGILKGGTTPAAVVLDTLGDTRYDRVVGA